MRHRLDIFGDPFASIGRDLNFALIGYCLRPAVSNILEGSADFSENRFFGCCGYASHGTGIFDRN